MPRSKIPGSAASFSIGDNHLTIPWDWFRGSATINIPSPQMGQVSLNDDLILLLATSSAILLSSRGYVLATFPVSLSSMLGQAVGSEPGGRNG